MAWSVDYIEELDIVQQSWSGLTEGSDFKAAATARVALGREKGTSAFLVDATDIICEKVEYSIPLSAFFVLACWLSEAPGIARLRFPGGT